MIYHLLYITVQFRPEVIERILRVIRHRGFIVCGLHVFPYKNSNPYDGLHVYVTIVSKRSVDILCEHLNKLIDVSYVVIQDSNQNYDCLEKHILCS